MALQIDRAQLLRAPNSYTESVDDSLRCKQAHEKQEITNGRLDTGARYLHRTIYLARQSDARSRSLTALRLRMSIERNRPASPIVDYQN